MSEFLERNKKKSLLALLLLFLRRGKGLGPLVAMLLLLASLFVVPAGFLGNVPWASKMLERMGILSPKEQTFDGLDDALRSARSARNLGLRMPGGSEYYGKSTVGLVKGGKELMGPSGGKDGVADMVTRKGGKTVDGVLTPEDAKKGEQGVSVDEDELRGGLLENAFAGMIGAGGPEAAMGGLAATGAGGPLSSVKGGKGALGGEASGFTNARADDTAKNLLKNTFDSTKVPTVAGGRVNARAASGDRIAWQRLRGLKTAMHAVGVSPSAGKNTVMYQLAEGRAYSIAAAPPPGYCNPGPCPNEYASKTSGSTFDGGRPGGSIMTAEEFGDPGVPMIPDAGQTQALIDEANQLEEDGKKCEEAERDYGPLERKKMAEIQATSDQINSSCQGGGCKSNKGLCRSLANKIRQQCNEYNSIASQKAAACPLMNGQYSAMNCNQ